MSPQLTAQIFLLVVAATPVVSLVLLFRRSPYSFLQSVLFFADVLLVRLLWGARVPKQFPLPPGQGAVLICNHRSGVDPFFLQLPAGRPVHWMVAREYCEHALFGRFLRACLTISVGRGGVDTTATKNAIRLASQGGYVGMFPEGRINVKDEFLKPVRPGAALIALKARVPILPCYIDGAPFRGSPLSPFSMAARVRVYFGEPIDLSSYYGREREAGVLEEVIRCSMKRVAKLAGHDDYEVIIAGRKWKPSQEEVASDMAESYAKKR